MNWRKASHSSSGGEQCVEVANAPHAIAVRDTTQANLIHRTTLSFSPAAWSAFTASLR